MATSAALFPGIGCMTKKVVTKLEADWLNWLTHFSTFFSLKIGQIFNSTFGLLKKRLKLVYGFAENRFCCQISKIEDLIIEDFLFNWNRFINWGYKQNETDYIPYSKVD